MGLFELLEEYPSGMIVLDDVAEILRSRIALQLLLAALGRRPNEVRLLGQPENARLITYRRHRVEKKIIFTGGIIAISNLELHDGELIEAIKSRADAVAFNPSDREIASLMLEISARGFEQNGEKLTAAWCPNQLA